MFANRKRCETLLSVPFCFLFNFILKHEILEDEARLSDPGRRTLIWGRGFTRGKLVSGEQSLSAWTGDSP